MSEKCGLVNVYIEIEQFSNQKYEFNKEKGELELDRVLNHPFVYPYAYGFIPNTLAQDGDDLDALIITDASLNKGKTYQAKIIGVLIMEDEKGMDEKILCVLESDFTPLRSSTARCNIAIPVANFPIFGDLNVQYFKNVQDIGDLPISSLENIKWFFENYKNGETGKWSNVHGFDQKDEAIKIYNKYKI
jgi:inorganic pyrophosphatase